MSGYKPYTGRQKHPVILAVLAVILAACVAYLLYSYFSGGAVSTFIRGLFN